MVYTAGVITLSDKGAEGKREDLSGETTARILEEKGWQVMYRNILPDQFEEIKAELIHCADELKLDLICTTGGTGFSVRDVTPEATLAVVERLACGIPEAMRMESMKFTKKAMLSRAVAGIRKGSLIINLPGSPKAVAECLGAVIDTVQHGVEILKGDAGECARKVEEESRAEGLSQNAKVIAVCISENKGEQKHEVKEAMLIENHGIEGDAHAGNWHRQVSLLAVESVDKVQEQIDFQLSAGDFAENILTQGILLHEIEVGKRLSIGDTLCEVTQIGKECHNHCKIREKAGDCVMPREGIFVKVLSGGKIKAGDIIRTL